MHNIVKSSPRAPRILLYSHDTFGLGHLRRTRAIAERLVAAFAGASALILTGSPVAGRFAFSHGVDHIRLPGVVKTPDGDYVSQSLDLTIDQTTALRASVIEAATEDFNPDLIIVDKEATGFRGEMMQTLERVRSVGQARLVLGIRDILDAPELLEPEWERKGALEATEYFYDQIWVYGDESLYDPFQGLNVSDELRRRVRFTGYLRREVPLEPSAQHPDQPYVLVTPGGGGDGEALVEWTLRAYESDASLPDALIVYGPFLSGEKRASFDRRVGALRPRVSALGFDSRIEVLMRDAQGIVAMGGYNTFCEILSFDRPAVIAPRMVPRMEQYIRASVAERLGLVRMLDRQRDGDSPRAMAAAIHGLISQPLPSSRARPGMLNGLDQIVALAEPMLSVTADL